MITDRHIAWYAEAMAILSGFQHDDMGGCGKESAEANEREDVLMGLLSRTPPETPAEAAAMLRFWLAWLRSGEGSNVKDELDYLAMSNVADFLEALSNDKKPDPALIPARLRDLDPLVRRAEMHIEMLFGQDSKAA